MANQRKSDALGELKAKFERTPDVALKKLLKKLDDDVSQKTVSELRTYLRSKGKSKPDIEKLLDNLLIKNPPLKDIALKGKAVTPTPAPRQRPPSGKTESPDENSRAPKTALVEGLGKEVSDILKTLGVTPSSKSDEDGLFKSLGQVQKTLHERTITDTQVKKDLEDLQTQIDNMHHQFYVCGTPAETGPNKSKNKKLQAQTEQKGTHAKLMDVTAVLVETLKDKLIAESDNEKKGILLEELEKQMNGILNELEVAKHTWKEEDDQRQRQKICKVHETLKEQKSKWSQLQDELKQLQGNVDVMYNKILQEKEKQKISVPDTQKNVTDVTAKIKECTRIAVLLMQKNMTSERQPLASKANENVTDLLKMVDRAHEELLEAIDGPKKQTATHQTHTDKLQECTKAVLKALKEKSETEMLLEEKSKEIIDNMKDKDFVEKNLGSGKREKNTQSDTKKPHQLTHQERMLINLNDIKCTAARMASAGTERQPPASKTNENVTDLHKMVDTAHAQLLEAIDLPNNPTATHQTHTDKLQECTKAVLKALKDKSETERILEDDTKDVIKSMQDNDFVERNLGSGKGENNTQSETKKPHELTHQERMLINLNEIKYTAALMTSEETERLTRHIQTIEEAVDEALGGLRTYDSMSDKMYELEEQLKRDREKDKVNWRCKVKIACINRVATETVSRCEALLIQTDAASNEIKSLTKQLHERDQHYHRQTSDAMDSELRKSSKDLRSVPEIARLTEKLSETKDRLHEVVKEKDHLLTRLSKIAGSKLTDGNANIADLSDPNRPTKLAEQFGQIYDNEWTDAFDYKTTVSKRNDVEAIAELLSILQKSYDFCMDSALNHLEETKQILCMSNGDVKSESTKREINKEDLKQLKDLRKSAAPLCVDSLEKRFLCHLFGKGPIKESKEIRSYITSCVRLCWLMSVQDPPVCLLASVKKGEQYNQDLFRFFTKSGLTVHYVVWPAVLLHNGGPLLSKGVAQGMKKK